MLYQRSNMSLARCWLFAALLVLAAPVTADTPQESAAAGGAVLVVQDPFVEMHTAPGRGYPVFHVIEQGEEVELLKRRTNWYKVRSPDGQLGWTRAAQLGHTLEPTGIPADLPSVGHGDYLKSSWRVGFTAGSFEGSSAFSVTSGYRFLKWAGLELEIGKIYDQSVTADFRALNLIIEPMPHWNLTPYVLLGTGEFSFDKRQKVLLRDLGDADSRSVGLGAGWYMGRNFLVRAEYRQHNVSADTNDVDLDEWKIGLNCFF